MTRFELLLDHGCVCCRQLGHKNPSVEIHHLVEGKRRLGDDYTIPLCAYHHRGLIPPDVPESFMIDTFGVSRHHHGRRAFEKQFGKETDLLERVNRAIA